MHRISIGDFLDCDDGGVAYVDIAGQVINLQRQMAHCKLAAASTLSSGLIRMLIPPGEVTGGYYLEQYMHPHQVTTHGSARQNDAARTFSILSRVLLSFIFSGMSPVELGVVQVSRFQLPMRNCGAAASLGGAQIWDAGTAGRMSGRQSYFLARGPSAQRGHTSI